MRNNNDTGFSLRLYSRIQASAASMKLSVSLQLLDLWQSAGLLGLVISSSQGLYLDTPAENHTQPTHGRSMHGVEFNPTVPASAQARTVLRVP
jgi:hypothetical protein